MSNKILHLVVAILICSSSAHGITLAELEKKNNEAMELEIKIAIATKEKELAATRPAPPVVINTPPIQKPKISPLTEIEGIALTEVFGDISNSSARFEINGAQIVRKKYGTIYSWTVQQINNDQVVLVRNGKTKKDDLVKIIYKSSSKSVSRPAMGQQTPVGREAFRIIPNIHGPAGPIGPIGVIQQR
ncbi:hypothetical protein [Janthinobacterium sp. FW305-128]|uniref:hypothetical protein n=1 Tax=Janthinobacterium sp. FW305-128 TaxID=2775055 RepID=UPI001E47C4B5|nr:hypothetical protein [Janthinobacterium sp. FW305-128]MCC7684713.1 hypothetical protein [Janthinobacterium sp. FW305-128]